MQQFQLEEMQQMLRKAEWKQKEHNKCLNVLQAQHVQHQQATASQLAMPTVLPSNRLQPPPRKEQAMVRTDPIVPSAEQKQTQQEAVVIVKETAYRQFIANLTTVVSGPHATALWAECVQLHAAYDRDYPPAAPVRQANAPAVS